jgi:succinoglycan biosynthesis transport protein ExoP
VPESEEAPSLNLGQVLGIVTRGRWWILTAMCVVTALATVVAYLLPDRFTSEATLLVVQQQVPQRYVTPTSTLGLADALQAMTQEVLSTKRLLELIDQFGLYAKERQRLAPEQVIALMRKYINIDPIEPPPGSKSQGVDFNSFKISFTSEKALLAQAVTSQLTSSFIQENLKVRGEQAATTTNFLLEHMDAAKKKLAEQEERLKDFKMHHLGELPEQQQSNIGILSAAQAELQNTTASLDRAQQQRVYLQSLLEAYQRLAEQRLAEQRFTEQQRLALRSAAMVAPSSQVDTAAVNDPAEVLQADILKLQASRIQLLKTLRELHPDVVALDQEIAAKQALLKTFQAAKIAAAKPPQGPSATKDSTQKSSGPTPAVARTSSIAPEDASIAQVKSQLESNRLEIENLTNDEKQHRTAISEYQSRLNMTPVREQELAGILRDYELSKKEYEDLLGKEQQSQLATSLEKRQGGQQFRLAEPPSLPTLPSSPKRIKIALGGAGGGLALGLLLAVLAEFKQPKLYDDKEVSRRFSIPLVVGLPVLLTPPEARRRRWRRLLEWSAGSVMMVGVLAAECYVYLHP